MKKFISVMVVLGCCMTLAACSSSQTSEDGFGDEVPSADAGTDAVPSDSAEAPPASTPDEAKATTEAAKDSTAAPADSAPPAADTSTPPASDSLTAATTPAPDANASAPAETPVAAAPAPESMSGDSSATTSEHHDDVASSSTGDGESHTVQRGETLMKIAFEAYGDLYKWRTIYEANRDKIQDPNLITTGTVLTIPKSSDVASNSRNGEKYQIKRGDTLGTISKDVYGTPTKWKKIWDNNREQIKDPNRIFAGFYLYYVPEDQMQGTPALGHQEQGVPAHEQPAAPQVDARAPAAVAPAPVTPAAVTPAVNAPAATN